MPPFLRNFLKHSNAPVLLLIIFNLLVGAFTFRDYGLTLDEPLYYQYADALGYAYSPGEWFSGNFDLENSFGPSGSDHQNRGPAYLLLAREPARLLQNALGMDYPSAWHLINFISFQFGVYFFFVFSRRWMKNWAAFAATLFFATQPLLWGHAFINPKDPPFLAAFLISLELGFRMADRIANPQANEKTWMTFTHILFPALVLGFATNLRVLGPLAGLLAFVYFLFLRKPARSFWFIPYGLIALVTLFVTWPFLWQAPIQNLFEVLYFFSDNPTELRLLFRGEIYTADNLPLRYLPTLLAITLTEPVWPLAIAGFFISIRRWQLKTIEWKTLLPVLLWFIIPLIYVFIRRPAMYDSFRHSLYILPPVFVLAGIALDAIFRRVSMPYIKITLIGLLILPAIWADIQLHPYQYTYYNQFVGGTGEASYNYETDYWSTCYKDAAQEFASIVTDTPTLYVGGKGIDNLRYYANRNFVVEDYLPRRHDYTGKYVLSSSRANNRLPFFNGLYDKETIRVERDNAIFCVIRKIK
ncbi:MAG: hypothetical protein MUO77_10785 [Anaerolineales bacterium]|nr:hypothetical protein [Anaerolineales bacterium]